MENQKAREESSSKFLYTCQQINKFLSRPSEFYDLSLNYANLVNVCNFTLFCIAGVEN